MFNLDGFVYKYGGYREGDGGGWRNRRGVNVYHTLKGKYLLFKSYCRDVVVCSLFIYLPF